ncbi:MAG: type IV toxin-antitoxin system AbiEi family antitoxin domain-containing protein [Dermatophilaceae bacterium]
MGQSRAGDAALQLAVPPELLARAADQFGAVTRAQCQGAGMTEEAVRWRVKSGHWRRLHRGVFLAHASPADLNARAMGAVLAAGVGSAVSHTTAGVLYGLVADPGPAIHLAVDQSRRVEQRPGLVVHRVTDLDGWVAPTSWPPRITLERTVLDLADIGTLDQAIAVVTFACQRELTTPSALARDRPRRRGQRWGRQLRDILDDVADGAHSVMEVRYIRGVERPHGLPTAERQMATDCGRRRYHDNGYREQRVIVELDGRLGHAGWTARRGDLTRDRQVAADGWFTVRAGWHDVAGTPCRLAQEVADVMCARGWQGTPRRCRRRGCHIRQLGSPGGTPG